MGRHSLSVSCCGILTSLFGITEMNERIKELAEQCTSWSEGSTWTSREVFDKEKFAELIVRECAELIDNKEMITAAQTYDEVFVAKYDIKELSAKQIREHFGVEE
jgi:hypothetical protein